MKMLQLEISRHKWDRLMCGCLSTAEHIPRDFLESLEGPATPRPGAGWADNHAYVQSNLMQPAIATASIVMAALADGAPLRHRRNLMAVLLSLANGEQDDIADKCLNVIRGGTWILYEEVASGRSIDAAAYAFEVLQLMDEESDRLAVFQASFSENLPQYLR
ncbi:hypothetical protein [Streptomyces nondiastaticus]|uniref:Uncharacterized protein n=1 Tax=Streptomyces nondiastaticus TaxID=3154512 RepID=A0ABW6TUZ1_9ACTN